MRLVTWNVNSIKQRLPRVLAMIRRHEPDIVCLQETKVEDPLFPTMELVAAGYECATFGQRAYNGVAILSRVGLKDVRSGFEGDPIPGQARVLSARTGDLRVVCAYVVNGQAVGTPAYETKLAWLDAFRTWVAETFDPADPLVICGDLNIAPDDRDVWDPVLWRGSILASEPERAAVSGPFTFWDYTAGAFHKGWGLRIDLALGTAPVADRLESAMVDRDERKPTYGEGKPSDHAPLIVTLI